MLSLQKLRQFNKNLRKHQTKMNPAINTNYLKLQKNWNLKILKSIVKRINWISYINYLCSEDALQKWSKPTGEQQCRSAISTKPLGKFIKSTPTHRYAPKNSQDFKEHPLWWNFLLQEDTSGRLLLQFKGMLKDLKCKRFLFTVLKRNLLTLKMNK